MALATQNYSLVIPELSDLVNSTITALGQSNITVDGLLKSLSDKVGVINQGNVTNAIYGGGADPTGVADSTVAIQAAIDAIAGAGGGVVYFPMGTYKTTGQLVLKDKVSLRGDGRDVTIIKNTNNTNIIFINTDAGDLFIADLTLDGNTSVANDANGIVANSANTNILIEKCKLIGIGDIGILITGIGTGDITIKDNIINRVGYDGTNNPSYHGNGIYVNNGASNLRIEGNDISNTYGHACVWLGGVSGAVVRNNILHDTFWRAIECSGSDNFNVCILDNVIYNTGSINDSSNGVGTNGIYLEGTQGDADYTQGNFLVSGNYLRNLGENGIEAWQGAIIADNYIETTWYRGLSLPTTSKEGILVCNQCIVRNNTIKNPASQGVAVNCYNADWKDIVIAGNYIENAGIQEVGAAIRAFVNGDGQTATLDGIIVKDNIVKDLQAAPTTLIGIQIGETGQGTIVGNAYCIGNIVGGNIPTELSLVAIVETGEVEGGGEGGDTYYITGDGLGNFVSVKENPFNAAGDGVTNDTAAIQAALDASNDVYFPPGTYMIQGSAGSYYAGIKPKSNQRLWLSKGATLRQIDTSNSHYAVILVKDKENVEIRGGTVQGDRLTSGTFSSYGMGISIQNSDNVLVEGVTIKDCSCDGIYVGNNYIVDTDSTGVRMVSNHISNNGRQGISVVAGLNCVLQGNVISNINGQMPQGGIDIEPNANTRCENISIIGNVVRDCYGYGIMVGRNTDVVATSTLFGISVVGNNIIHCARLNVEAGTMDASPTSAAGLMIQNCHGCTMSNNNVIDSEFFGIYLNVCKYCVISGNTVIGSMKHGMRILVASHNNIQGNYIFGSSRWSNNQNRGINIEAGSVYNNIQGNTVRCNTEQANNANYGINVSSGCDNNIITNNDLYDAGNTGDLYDDATGTVTTAGNRLSS